MSLDTLMHEAALLDAASQRKLIGYLVTLRDGERPEHRKEMARRIDDKSPERWLTLDQLDAKLAQIEP
jgi:hypothetical protein